MDLYDQPEYLTREKYEELERELEELKTVKRREIAKSLEHAKSFGDLAENAEYDEARAQQASLEERILKLKSIIKRAVIIASRHAGTIGLGSRVVVEKDGSKETFRWQVVGSQEADIKAGKISNESPVGRALLGKKKGDSFSIPTPKGETKYKIVELE